jgi:hypothetical protein
VLKIAASGNYSSHSIAAWKRYANVRIVPIRLCANTKAEVRRLFRHSSTIAVLQNAVYGDPLITASLQRSRYDVGDVFAVETRGGQLTVYVY